MNDIPHRKNWDVIIVGAGPAGSAAAIKLARLNLDVLLVDRKSFPRRKVCGGCLNQVSFRLIKELLGEQHPLANTENQLKQFKLHHAGRHFEFDMPNGRAVDRSVLDMCLVEACQKGGVTFATPVAAELGDNDNHFRELTLNCRGRSEVVKARAIVLATGLASRALVDFPSLQQSATNNSRVGIEAIYRDFSPFYHDAAIHMAVANSGYVGLTRISDTQLHVAAAVDRPELQRMGPFAVVRSILQDSGAAAMSAEAVSWRGTPPLTTRPIPLGTERVFLIGDAAGYVEPFTGEGIRWALESGTGVAPFVAMSQNGWSPSILRSWEDWYRGNIRSEQKLCRLLTKGIRSRILRGAAHRVLCLAPVFANHVIKKINS